MGFNLTVLKMNPDLFACRYMESIASQTDHFGNTFVHINTCWVPQKMFEYLV